MLPRLNLHPWMNDEIEIFRTQVHRFIEGEIAPSLPHWRRQGYIPRQVWHTFGQMGFLLPELDEAHGASAVSKAYQLVVQNELARAEVPANTAVHTIVAHYIRDYGTTVQRHRWLPRLVSGDLFGAIALTEPGCGSDLKALRTRARRDGDHYLIDGSKTFITNGFTSNLLLLAARTDDAGSRGVSLFVLETEGLPGFRVGPRMTKLGQHASDTTELFFDEVRVPADQLLGLEAGRGFAQLMSQLPYERLILCVTATAVIERAVELAVAYTQERRAFGQSVFDFQNTRFKLAECATLAHIARTLVNDCIQRLLDDRLDDQAAYMAKWWCTEQQGKVTDECLQLFGGSGYMAESPIARLYADARIQRIYGGTTEIMKELIARELCQ